MSSSPPNERSGNDNDNGLNDTPSHQRTLHNSNILPTPDSSSNNSHYSTSVSNRGEGLSLTNSLRDAGLGSGSSVGASGTTGATAESAPSHSYNPMRSNSVNSNHYDAASSNETSDTTAGSGSSITPAVPSNAEAPANGSANPTGSSYTNNGPNSAASRARNANSNFVFTYRDGRLVRMPTRSMGSSDDSLPEPSEADGSESDPREQEEVARLVTSVLSGLGFPVNLPPPSESASASSRPEAAATPQTYPQPPSPLNSSPMNTLHDPAMAPADTQPAQGSRDQPRSPQGLPDGGVLVSLSFDVERGPINRDRNGFPNLQSSRPPFHSYSSSPTASRPHSSGSERQSGTDRDADLEAFRRSMADARANGRDINWREAIRTSRESSRPPSARQSSGSSEPSVRSVPETTIPSSNTSNVPNLANLSSPLPSMNPTPSSNPLPDIFGGLPPFFGAIPVSPPAGAGPGGSGGMGGISGIWVPGDATGPFPIPFFAPFFGPGTADFLSGEKPPDKRRARELLRGLKVAPKGLIKRLEEVERVRSIQPSKAKPGEKQVVEGPNDGQGKLLCAVCWEPLLPADESSEGEDDHLGHQHEQDKTEMEVDDGTADADADDEMDIDEEDTEVAPTESNTATTKSKAKARRPPPWANQLIALPCTHIFHAECLEPWFTTSKTTCPTCRFDVDPESLTLDLGRLFGNSRRSRNNATPTNGAGRPSAAPSGPPTSTAATTTATPTTAPAPAPAPATAATGAGVGSPTGSNAGGAGDGNAGEDRIPNVGEPFSLLRSIFASAMARAIAGAIHDEGPEAPQPSQDSTTSRDDNNQSRINLPSDTDSQPLPRATPFNWPPRRPSTGTTFSDIPLNIPRSGNNNDEPAIGIPVVVVEDGLPPGTLPEDDPEVLGSVNQILSSLFGAAAMAGPQPSPSAPQMRDFAATSLPNPSNPNPQGPTSASIPRPNPSTGSTEASSPASSIFSTPIGSSRPQTPSARTGSPSWGFGFQRTYTLGPGVGLGGVGLGTPNFTPRPMSPATPMSGGSDRSTPTPVPNFPSAPPTTAGPSTFLSMPPNIPSPPSFTPGGRAPSGIFPIPSGMTTPSGAFPGSSSSRLGAGPRPSTPTSSSRHHPYAYARPHTSNVSSPSTGANDEASNDSRPSSAGGNRPEFTITHHTITFSWGVPADVPMRDPQANADPANSANPSNDNSTPTQGPQSSPPPNGFAGPFPLDPQTPFRTIFQSTWTGGPRPVFTREGGSGLFGPFGPAPSSGGIGATRTTPGSNTSSNRPRRKWVAPEGSSLRSVVEAREREVGLRCDDVSCLWGPEDDDDPEDNKVVRKERVFLKKSDEVSETSTTTPTQACAHRFHPECLLVSTRVSEPMIEEEIDEGGDNEPIEVSCPRCRTRGSMKKAEWRHCKQLAELI